ncbi:unnamed protein product [Moneuplotes crassus]|uniref:Uncharacterized protein n=1 Tax=Euplotes crassus TaxID=5936 RepID=A0AAD1UPG4_EUPCR|nr:unnamed protein product [Moneuplotes crassus]
MIKPVTVLYTETKDVYPRINQARRDSSQKVFGISKAWRAKRVINQTPEERVLENTNQKVFQITRNCSKFTPERSLSLNSLCGALNEQTQNEQERPILSSSKVFAVTKLTKLERKVALSSPKFSRNQNMVKNCQENSRFAFRSTRSNTMDECEEESRLLNASKQFEKVFQITKEKARVVASAQTDLSLSPKAPSYKRYFTVRKVPRSLCRRKTTFGGISSAFTTFSRDPQQYQETEGHNFYTFLASELSKYGRELQLESCNSPEVLLNMDQKVYLSLSLGLKLLDQLPDSSTAGSLCQKQTIKRPLAKYK